MIKEFIGTGKTIEEATKAAHAGLNAPSSADVKIEVVAMPQKKLFGLFGGSDAKVKASYDDGKKEKKMQPRKDAPKKEAPKKEASKKKAPSKKETPKPVKAEKAEKAAKAPQAEKPKEKLNLAQKDLDYACAYLKSMIEGLQVKDPQITAHIADGTVEMEIDCADYGIIIGRRGDTLDALQYLTSLAIKKQTDKYVRVTLNVGNYREKRVETLRNLAKKNAAYVLRTGRRYTFEPMNPYERRILHTTVQEIEGVESRSIGFDLDRRVVLEPEGGVKSNGYGGRRGGSGYSKRGSNRSASRPAAANAAPKADRADLPKFGKIELNKD